MGGNQWKFNWWVGEGRGKNASDGRITEIKVLWPKRVESKDTGLLEPGCLSGRSGRERGQRQGNLMLPKRELLQVFHLGASHGGF